MYLGTPERSIYIVEGALDSVGRFADGTTRLRGWKRLTVKIAVGLFLLGTLVMLFAWLLVPAFQG